MPTSISRRAGVELNFYHLYHYTVLACFMYLYAATVLMCIVLSPWPVYIFVSSLVYCVTDAMAKEQAKARATAGT